MPPHPKRKHSSGRRDRRRAHDALVPTELINCSNCGVPDAAHRVPQLRLLRRAPGVRAEEEKEEVDLGHRVKAVAARPFTFI